MKIYTQVDTMNEVVTFRISRMETVYEIRNGQPDVPHKHHYYTILIIREARGMHYIDFKAHTLTERQIYFLSPGQAHQLVEEKKSVGYIIVFSDQFLAENNIPMRFIDELRLFNAFRESPPLTMNPAELDHLSSYCDELERFYTSGLKFKEQAISSLLNLILIQCNNLCGLNSDHTQNLEARHSILQNFKKMVEEKYTDWHLPSDYARELSVSADHLNRVIKTLTGATAREFIQSRLISEAKRLLYFTDMSVKEIGFKLGFDEPANFSAFYKNNTGNSPSEFRANK
ncbi:MAG TPA: transcriptional regulator [Bacteroidales bacterium]|nr:transcriptional regulator [Bacteroidales bacterium]